jgi:D-alanyl-lipoteichoic acid acyltransferase DltB (MBOAT superfamily)
MLFNSFAFLLCFLPVTVAGFFLLGKRGGPFGAAWLAFASLFFYGWWDYRYVPLLLASITANYWFGSRIGASAAEVGRRWLVTAITCNLGLLAYYKYAGFFLSSIAGLTGTSFGSLDIVLPIGISFFTFTQIAFLVDAYQGKAKEYRFIHYVLFVTYFPHLIAGPVLHHKEMMPQFAAPQTYRPDPANLAVGLAIFIIGLAKKVLIADNIAPYGNALFSAPATPSLLIAWGGVLAYTFQLYFDFSGYSDMAIGLSRLFGVRLPLNFDSPYKSASITEFWRRWHMTLSRFLRDYLYIAMGGNRHGQARRYANLMATMLLGGLWHGAGWNYVIWGGLHGLYLIVNHAWSGLAARLRFRAESPAWRVAATALTFVSVCFAWVFFRADTLGAATEIIRGMLGGFGLTLPDAIGLRIGSLKPWLENAGVVFSLGGGSRFVETWGWTLFAAFVAFALPNTQQITRRFDPALDARPASRQGSERMASFEFEPSRRWALLLGLLAVASLLSLNRPSEFLYFQF